LLLPLICRAPLARVAHQSPAGCWGGPVLTVSRWPDEVAGSVAAEGAGEPYVGSAEFLTHPLDAPPCDVPVHDIVGEGAGPTHLVECLPFPLFFVAAPGHPGAVEQGGDPGGRQTGAATDLSARAVLDLGQESEVAGQVGEPGLLCGDACAVAQLSVEWSADRPSRRGVPGRSATAHCARGRRPTASGWSPVGARAGKQPGSGSRPWPGLRPPQGAPGPAGQVTTTRPVPRPPVGGRSRVRR